MTARKSYFGVLLIVTSLWVIIFALMKDLTVLSHHSYFDFAVFLEYFNNFAQGKGLISTVQEAAIPGRTHWLSNHFTPIIYLFAFAYKIFPSFRTINWLQTMLMAISPLILYRLSRRFIGTFGAFCISLALLFNPTFQYITLYEFEYLRFIIPMGILALGVTVGGYSALFVLSSSLAVLLVREDAVFMVFGVGVFVFFFQRDRRKLGGALIAIALIYLVIVLQVIMPLFRGAGSSTHIAAPIFHEFGKTLPEILQNIWFKPGNFLAHLFHPFKLFNWIMYILPFSFVPLAGADVLVIMLPTFSLLSFSGAVTHISYFLYYVAPILVVVTWAAVLGVPRLDKYLNECKERFSWLRCLPHPSIERISFAVLTGSLACSIYFGPSPISIQFWNEDFSLAPFRTNTFYKARYIPTAHDDVVRKVAAMIPHDASVSTEQFLLSDIYKCKSLKVFPTIEGVDYVFIDKLNPRKTGIGGIPGSWHGLRKNPQFYYDWVEMRPEVFELIRSDDGIYLYKRRQDAPPYPQPFDVPPGITVTKEEVETAKRNYLLLINSNLEKRTRDN